MVKEYLRMMVFLIPAILAARFLLFSDGREFSIFWDELQPRLPLPAASGILIALVGFVLIVNAKGEQKRRRISLATNVISLLPLLAVAIWTYLKVRATNL